ncbi:MAG: TonB-dependent receptor, partial [Bacteroidetes bacterium 4572_77]
MHKVIHENDPNLKQETSQSVMGSLDYNGDIGNMYVGFLVEGFYTMLIDPFVTEYVPSEDENIMVCYRSNSEDGAKVAGLNTELRLAPIQSLELSGGFTYQISRYDIAQDDFNEKAFYRTPDNYGFITVDWDLTEMFGISVSGNYTGSMLVPYFGIEDRGIADYDPENGALIESDSFFDMGFKLSYDFYLGTNIFQIYGGMKNILNSYQNDFDSGI